MRVFLTRYNKAVYKIAVLCLLPLAFIVISSFRCFSQKYNFINFNVENGLVQSQVMCMTQDSNNELWLGTFGGISLFDGSNFINYSKSDGLPNNLIMSISYGSRGKIWIGTSAGITCYDGYGFKTIAIPDINGDKIVSDIKIDKSSGTVWARVNLGLYYLEGNKFVKDNTLDTVTALIQDKDGHIRAAAFERGIYLLDGKKMENGAKR